MNKILIILFSLFSCSEVNTKKVSQIIVNGEEFSKVETFYAGGNPEYLFYLDKNEKYHFEFIRWMENGDTAVKAIFYHGLKNGIEYSWWENGQMSSKCNYSMGKKNGDYLMWSITGQTIKESFYLEDSVVSERKIVDTLSKNIWFDNLLKSGIDSSKAKKVVDDIY